MDSQILEFKWKTLERTVTLPPMEFDVVGKRAPMFDIEPISNTDSQCHFFQRPVAYYNGKGVPKTFDHTNLLMCCQIPQPLQFSLHAIAVDYDRECKELNGATLVFYHASSNPIFQAQLSDLPSMTNLAAARLPAWFLNEANTMIRSSFDCINREKISYLPTWAPGHQYRHIRAGEALFVLIKKEGSSQDFIHDVKVSLDGIVWMPK